MGASPRLSKGKSLRPLSKPIIGAINGVAVTGGFELALNCDFLIASDQASFADTHARVGIQPGWGLTVLLPQAIGLRRAREMSTTGNFVDARTALEWGLVNRVVAHEDLLPTCRTLAADIVSNDQAGVRRILRTYQSPPASPPFPPVGWKPKSRWNGSAQVEAGPKRSNAAGRQSSSGGVRSWRRNTSVAAVDGPSEPEEELLLVVVVEPLQHPGRMRRERYESDVQPRRRDLESRRHEQAATSSTSRQRARELGSCSRCHSTMSGLPACTPMTA